MPGLQSISFDELPAGTRVSQQYLASGIRFSLIGAEGGPLAVAAGSGGLGRVLSLGPTGPSSRIHDLAMDFAVGAVFASFVVLDADEAFSVRVFDGAGQAVLPVSIEALPEPIQWPRGPAYRVTVGHAEGTEVFHRIELDVTNGLGSATGGPEFVDSVTFFAPPIADDLSVRFGQGANARSWILPGSGTVWPAGTGDPPHPDALLPGSWSGPWDQQALLGGLVEADSAGDVHRITASAWGAVRNVQALATSAERLRIEGFVHVDVVVGSADHRGSEVEVIGAKRGNVATGAGDDTIVLAAASNGADWGQTMRLSAGDGNDRIVLGTLDALQAGQIEGVEAPGPNEAFLWPSTGKKLDGSGRGQWVYGWGGYGDDRFELGGTVDRVWGGPGADRFEVKEANGGSDIDAVFDFDAGRDVLDLSALDADLTRAGNQAFVLGGSGAGSLRFERSVWNFLEASADRNGDGVADWSISLGYFASVPSGSHLIL